MNAKFLEFWEWAKAQLADPTSGMHLLAFYIVIVEVHRSWFTHTPLDLNKIMTAGGLFAGGLTADKFIKVP